MIEYLVGATAALAMLCMVGGYALMQQRRRFDARLATYLGSATVDASVGQSAMPTPRLTRRLIGINQLSLTQAGMSITARKFTVLQLALAFGLVALVWVFGRSLEVWQFAALPAAFVVGIVIPRLIVKFKRNKRLLKFEGQFAQALDALANAAEVGLSISQAMETISRDMPAPLGPEFGHVLRTMGMGVSLAEALDQLADRVPSRDVELFAAALSIQYRTGGALSPVLRKIADTVRERVNMRSEVKALTAQQRYSAYIISGLPVFLFALLKFISPSYFAMIMAPGTMRFILIGGTAGIVVGLFLMLRIADVEV